MQHERRWEILLVKKDDRSWMDAWMDMDIYDKWTEEMLMEFRDCQRFREHWENMKEVLRDLAHSTRMIRNGLKKLLILHQHQTQPGTRYYYYRRDSVHGWQLKRWDRLRKGACFTVPQLYLMHLESLPKDCIGNPCQD
jgi:hypothetical protein